MRENRWKSLSIMDLHLLKRGSLTHSGDTASEAGARYQQDSVGSHAANASGQSYELIKSTQVCLSFKQFLD